MIKCVVFDVDRTLVDSFEPEMLSLEEALINVKGYQMTQDEKNKLMTLPTNDFFKKKLNLSDEDIHLVNIEWGKTWEKYKTICFPNIKGIIKTLDKEGYTLGIVTSRTMEEVRELDREFMDIDSLFKIIVTSDIVNESKPNKESMDYLCSKLNYDVKEIVYVGDSEIDRLFAENSGCKFIPACWDNRELSNLKNACFNPFDIINIIENIKD